MIDIAVRLEAAHLRKTMVHEMCHVWCCIHHQDTSHSSKFWAKMEMCGYPLGHVQEGVSGQDKWSQADTTMFHKGQQVYFIYKDIRVECHIVRINRRTVTVQDSKSDTRWRVPPSMLRDATAS